MDFSIWRPGKQLDWTGNFVSIFIAATVHDIHDCMWSVPAWKLAFLIVVHLRYLLSKNWLDLDHIVFR